jgi:hypothetical protein
VNTAPQGADSKPAAEKGATSTPPASRLVLPDHVAAALATGRADVALPRSAFPAFPFLAAFAARAKLAPADEKGRARAAAYLLELSLATSMKGGNQLNLEIPAAMPGRPLAQLLRDTADAIDRICDVCDAEAAQVRADAEKAANDGPQETDDSTEAAAERAGIELAR